MTQVASLQDFRASIHSHDNLAGVELGQHQLPIIVRQQYKGFVSIISPYIICTTQQWSSQVEAGTHILITLMTTTEIPGSSGVGWAEFAGSIFKVDMGRLGDVVGAALLVHWNPNTSDGGIRLYNLSDGEVATTLTGPGAGYREDWVDIASYISGYQNTTIKRFYLETCGDGSTAPTFRRVELIIHTSEYGIEPSVACFSRTEQYGPYGTFEWKGKISNPGSQKTCFCGFLEVETGFMGDGFIGFYNENGTYKIATCTGGSSTITNLGGQDWTTEKTFRIEWSAGQVIFKVDGGTVGTHNTNVSPDAMMFRNEVICLPWATPNEIARSFIRIGSFQRV